jgi:hypothetical protein
MMIASHNCGYDDSRFGVKKKSNMKTAFQTWSQTHGEDEWAKFYGNNLTCPAPPPEEAKAETNSKPPSYCGDSPIHAETQRYVPPIIARHILAVCYYGQNHADMPAFSNWARFAEKNHYCAELFKIPTPQEL